MPTGSQAARRAWWRTTRRRVTSRERHARSARPAARGAPTTVRAPRALPGEPRGTGCSPPPVPRSEGERLSLRRGSRREEPLLVELLPTTCGEDQCDEVARYPWGAIQHDDRVRHDDVVSVGYADRTQ